ncbi:MAG TPA: hypothetical protein VNQ90_17660 [Chthoniobacteraceae bacterium]|nr:hypothetical protein [Chthoniobacteraceae bacterium]
MKRYITTLCLAIAVAGSALAELPKNVDALVDKLPESYTKTLRANAVRLEARSNDEFYSSLKAAGFTFQDVTLSRSWVVGLAFPRGDYDAFDSAEAAKYLSLDNYKSYVAAKLKGMGADAIAAYDWLQQQRLTVVEAAPRDIAEKGEFLAVIADQVIAQDKAKASAAQ